MSVSKPVVIDTDPGIDDALALILALRSPALDVQAITVVAGNTPLEACVSNALRIQEVLGLDSHVPVFEGCAEPLSTAVVRAEHVHGADGLGGVAERYPVRRLEAEPGHAVDRMAELAREFGDRLCIVALGPLTNVAAATARDPEAMGGIGELVIMGGSDDGHGNATPRAEFNFYSDPAAAKAVVRSGLPVTIVGLNVTEKALLPHERFRKRVEAMPPGLLREFLGAVTQQYFAFCRQHHGRDACALHDPLAVGAAIDPTIIGVERLECDVVDSPGLTRGMMVVRRGTGAPAASAPQVATAVDAGRFLELFLAGVCDT